VMGADGLFFASVGRLHARHHTPNIALLLLTGWSIVLVLSGSYGQLLDYATFGDWLACAVGVSTLFWYRRQQHGDVPFRVPGYPLLPLVFIATVAWVVVQSLRTSLVNTGIGLAIMAAGVPVYWVWRHLFRPAHP
jgi:basic amino acid/polyamine antiporter, APA family